MQYFLMFLLLFFCCLGKRYLKIKIFTANILSLLIIFWNICNDYTGEGINDAVLFTLKSNTDGAPLSDFINYILTYASFLTLSCVPYFLRNISTKFNKQNLLGLTFLSLALIIIFTKTNYTKDFFYLVKNLTFEKKIASKSNINYKQLKINSLDNIDLNKNLVIIIAESLERTHRDINGINFLPKISNLPNQIDFSNIVQMKGSGWTIAGHVNVLCGLPLVGLSNDATAMNTFLPKAICIPEVLEKKGYNSIYISGTDTHFSGTDNFLKLHGVKYIYNLNNLKKSNVDDNISQWGINDDVILNTAFDLFTNESVKKSKFNLIISTINTHAPDGLFLDSCSSIDTTQSTENMQKSILCSDYLIANFIQRIQSSPYYDNTTIILVSDHLMMGKHEYLIDKVRTNTFSIFDKDFKNKKIDNIGGLIDVLPTTLSLITHQNIDFGMGVNIIDGKKNDLLNKEKEDELLNVARSLWEFPNINDNLFYRSKRLIIGDVSLKLPFSAEIDSKGNIIYISNQGLTIEKHKKSLITNNNTNLIYAKRCNNSACILLGNNN
ncbi:hypothetical protein E4V43_18165 [Proteus mirabilis]|uniref:sulfatase-like hydrolase/transferase n=1 Tax=Proteus mirabilis TaxID=584 RepID=UPI00107185C8|nr:sulfatase-like hydrolase/transferase [Proteus mirabilis]TFT98621.1 hypothetical protein E4V43_18165 [Proteus mirabilis]